MRDRKRKSESGQAAVEFAVFTLILFLLMFLIVQLAWIGIQKWQFQHYAAYSARAWSVRTDWGAEETLIRAQTASAIGTDWNLFSKDWVKAMWVSSEDPKDVDDDNSNINGLTYTGIAPLMPIYRGLIGETLFDNPIPGSVMSQLPDFDIPSSGLVRFESFIPMEREPEEQPDESNRDNDCEGTPCESGNGR
jgi:hypothetical protein